MKGKLDTRALERAAEQEIERGLIACQVAVAHGGDVVWTGSFGSATPSTRFWVASATKPIVASAVWILIGEGKVDLARPLAHYLPEFGARGKQHVTVEQVMLMTCGFPNAEMTSEDGKNPRRRIQRLADWTLEYEPGTRYVYHGSSAHWALAELIERTSGIDFCDFVEQRVTGPLGLPRLLGLSRAEQTDIAQLSDAANDQTRSLVDYASKIDAGEPGGGGVMTASTLALFYQALLHDRAGIWDAEVLADGTTNVRCTLPDPVMNLPANRTTGVVVGAGFGATWGDSPTAFGWPGMGGQIGFADPATGVSFAFLQMGDGDEITTFVRATSMTKLALELGR